jgi:hypothetical protein
MPNVSQSYNPKSSGDALINNIYRIIFIGTHTLTIGAQIASHIMGAKKSPLHYLVIPIQRRITILVHSSLGHIIVHGDIVPVMFTVTIHRNMK